MAAFTPALYAVPHDMESARAWIQVLVDAGLSFHLEDDATDALETAVPHHGHRAAIEKGRKRLYELGLDWGSFECPIGYMAAYEKKVGTAPFWVMHESVKVGVTVGKVVFVSDLIPGAAIIQTHGAFIAAWTDMELAAVDAWENVAGPDKTYPTFKGAMTALTHAMTERRIEGIRKRGTAP